MFEVKPPNHPRNPENKQLVVILNSTEEKREIIALAKKRGQTIKGLILSILKAEWEKEGGAA